MWACARARVCWNGVGVLRSSCGSTVDIWVTCLRLLIFITYSGPGCNCPSTIRQYIPTSLADAYVPNALSMQQIHEHQINIYGSTIVLPLYSFLIESAGLSGIDIWSSLYLIRVLVWF